MARANEEDCIRLSAAIAPLQLSTRQVGELYTTQNPTGWFYREAPSAEQLTGSATAGAKEL